jgi:transposase-like protein
MYNFKPNQRPALRVSREWQIEQDQVEMLQEVKSWRSEIVHKEIVRDILNCPCKNTYYIGSFENDGFTFEKYRCDECGVVYDECLE